MLLILLWLLLLLCLMLLLLLWLWLLLLLVLLLLLLSLSGQLFINRQLIVVYVQDGVEFGIESDHSSLIWELNLTPIVPMEEPTPSNHLRKITNWSSFSKILDNRFIAAKDTFRLLSCAEQGEFIKHQIQVAGASVTPGQGRAVKKKPKTSSKMKKLLKQSKTIRKKIKQRIVQPQSSTLRLRTESKQIL